MTEPMAWIVSTGARGPLGLGAAQIAMCARAKKMEPLGTRFLGRNGEEMGACRMLGLPETIHGYDRLLRIAAPALCEAWGPGADARGEPIPLVVALPESGRADDDARFDHELVRDLAARSRRRVDVERSRVVRAGHAGGAIAVEIAARMLAQPGGPAAVLVGGVDSYHHPGVLEWLDAELRLHGPATEDGFIPSEGAAFALLTRLRPERGEAPPVAALRRVITGRETTATTDEPNLAATMTAILHALRADGPISWVLSDLNGEPYRAREWTLAEERALARGEPSTSPHSELIHDELAGELGDLGAATGPTLLAIACAYFEAGCAPAKDVVIALASDGAERGALRVEAVS